MTVLPCYSETETVTARERCNQRGQNGKVDALFIEGHTDDRPISAANNFKDNWDLSTARARTVYLGLVNEQGGLDRLRNREGQPLLSVSGYADRRGVAVNDTEENRRQNRRIDLRFVMVPPQDALPKPATETKESLERKR
jgi:chemotaxis protein MotB